MVAVTVRLTVAVVLGEFVGVMVTVSVPNGVLARVEIVNVTGGALVPSKYTLVGLKLQLAPVGSPVQLLGAKFTVMAEEPLTGAIVSVVVVDCPALTGIGLSAPAESWKSGSSVAFHATAKALASTDPRPVTWS